MSKDAIDKRVHDTVERAAGRRVSGNEKLGGKLSYDEMSVRALIQAIAQDLATPPPLHQGGLAAPTNTKPMLDWTVRGLKAWVQAQIG